MDNKVTLYNKIKVYGPIAVFSFFLLKGLLWLAAPTLIWFFTK